MQDLTKKLIDTDKQYLWHPFTQMAAWLESEPVIIDRAEGFHLIDTQGQHYIDGVSSLWCNVHGHRVAKIDHAIRDQLDRVAHSTLLGLGQTRSIELAEKLGKITPPGLDKVFYSDSGATAVEIAIKIAHQYYHNRGENRTKFIALQNAYHGDTIGSVSIGGMEVFHGIFQSLLFEAFFVPSPHPYRFQGTAEDCARDALDRMEAILKQHAPDVAAMVVEPRVQGAAGMIVHPEGFLRSVRDLASRYDTLLITDEVATGFGRTGKMFACEHENVHPDMMCLAKGITGGYLPLAATLTTRKIYDAFLGDLSEHKTFYHGHTYTGNALGCAAALASLELFAENKILELLPTRIGLIRERLERIGKLEYIGDVRQCGMMVGIEIVKDKATKESFTSNRTLGAKICAAMRPKGLMIRPLGDVVILMPPVAIDMELLEQMLDIVEETLAEDLPKLVGIVR